MAAAGATLRLPETKDNDMENVGIEGHGLAKIGGWYVEGGERGVNTGGKSKGKGGRSVTSEWTNVPR